MKKKKFNVNDWLPNEETNHGLNSGNRKQGFNSHEAVESDIEQIVSRIEAAHLDITAHYTDWLNIGFALASELGEAGRKYFLRISRFYPNFSRTACHRKYNQCLKAKGHGITIKTLFYLAGQAGAGSTGLGAESLGLGAERLEQGEGRLEEEKSEEGDGRRENGEGKTETDEGRPETEDGRPETEDGGNLAGEEIERKKLFNTPRLPVEIYSRLPELLRESCTLFCEGIEQDVFLISSLAVLSGCLPNIEGIYFDSLHSAHLYSFITAPAGSGKGKMIWAKYFGQAIHEHMTGQSQKAWAAYETELKHYYKLNRAKRKCAEKPVEPPSLMFFIPANSSASAFTQALSDNNFSGVIFESEADTLADTFKQDWGNFSDVLRKGFHHESSSMIRRKDKEFLEIREPHIAIVLSGTPKQVHNLMPDTENGLFSRFLYYAFEDDSEFKNPFAPHHTGSYTDFFRHKGQVVLDLYLQLQHLSKPITFKLTDEQATRFTVLFNTMLSKNKLLLGRDLIANIKRLGLITFRIAMILSALRTFTQQVTPIGFTEQVTGSHQLSIQELICNDMDFETAMDIAITLEKHAVAVYQNMPNNELKGLKLAFYEQLPLKFDRKAYLKVAKELGILPKTADKYIKQMKSTLLNYLYNEYTKK